MSAMEGLGSAGIVAGGGIAEGLIGSAGQLLANRANKRLAREQMAFQERMSNTSYQRMVRDMKAAGINPLYWMKGSGASTPGGSLPTMQNPLTGFGGTTARALEARVAAANMKNLDVQNAKILSEIGVNTANARHLDAQVRSLMTSMPKKELQGYLWKDFTEKLDSLNNWLNASQARAEDAMGKTAEAVKSYVKGVVKDYKARKPYEPPMDR